VSPRAFATAALLVLPLLTGLAQTASAQQPACGAVVTHDVKLDADVVCPAPGDPTGLVVGANGITIDLNGHRIVGGNTGFGGGGGIGIDNRGGFDRVTVKNGSIDAFSSAAVLANANRNRLVGLSLFGASTAVQLTGGTRDVIRGNTILGRGAGVSAALSDRMEIVENRISSAFDVAISANVARSDILRNGPGQFSAMAGFIRLSGDDNRVAGNDTGGAYIAGISVAGSDNVIALNRATGPSPLPGSGDGIAVLAGATGTTVRWNLATDNGDDGIDVDASGTRIAHNRANDNGDLGIEAVPGVIDGGDNHASGNGNPLQCLNVVCTP
jgi:parallel beta-helix repeat protein